MPRSSRKKEPPSPYVALLRGVNVGGKNKLPMSELVDIVRNCGCEEVATYIQSGNVIFLARPEIAKRAPGSIADRIAKRFGGVRIPVILRTATELRRVARSNPHLESKTKPCDPKSLHVLFLSEKPSRSRVAKLAPDRSPGDSFVVRGREIFLHLPNGVGRTRLTNAWFDRTLDATSTIRNWRTVMKLTEMVSEVEKKRG